MDVPVCVEQVLCVSWYPPQRAEVGADPKRVKNDDRRTEQKDTQERMEVKTEGERRENGGRKWQQWKLDEDVRGLEREER